MDLLQPLLPYHMQQRVLIIQFSQRGQATVRILPLRQQRVGEHRLQHRGVGVALVAQPLTGAAVRQAGDGADRAGGQRIDRGEFRTGIQAHLVGLLVAVKHHLRLDLSPGDAQPRQTVAMLVMRHLIYTCPETSTRFDLLGIPFKAGEEAIDALHGESGPEEHGEQRARGYHGFQPLVRDGAGVQELVHGRFVEHRDVFHRPGRSAVLEVHAAVGEPVTQLGEQCGPVGAGSVHLVDEYEGRHVVSPQQAPQRLGMPLDAVRPGHHQYGVIQHRQHALGLGGEIDVPRRIDEGDRQIAGSDDGGLGEYRDASRPLHRVGVEERIAVIDAAEPANLPRTVEQRFGQRGLARVHMSQNARDDVLFHSVHPIGGEDVTAGSLEPLSGLRITGRKSRYPQLGV